MQLLFSTDSSDCVTALCSRITDELTEGKQVLWFMTGGSNIAVDIQVMARLDSILTTNLTVTLTDERYGAYGHADSNWQQLLDGGFDAKQARTFPVLQQDNQSLEQTTSIYDTNLETAVREADTIIGFYGLGSDGHIAGILPDSPAVHDTGLAAGYVTEQFTRITSTFSTIRRCHVAYMCALGTSKLQPLQNLQTAKSLQEQPAQVLKQLPEAYVYNDQIKEQSS